MGAGVTALRRLGSSGAGKKHVVFTEARASEHTDRPLLTGDGAGDELAAGIEESGRCSCDSSTPQTSLRGSLADVECSVSVRSLGEGSEDMASMGVMLEIGHEASKPKPPDA